MKKRIAALITVILVFALAGSYAMASEVTAPAALAEAQNDDLRTEYAEANVVVDFYCLALFDNGDYALTGDFGGLDISQKDGETADEQAERIAQAAAALVKENNIEPTYPAQPLDVKIDNVLLGMYLLLPHGSDLAKADYFKEVDGKLVTVAQTDDTEYRFSPILAKSDYDNPEIEVEVKAEVKPKDGTVLIVKKLQDYEDVVKKLKKNDVTEEKVTFSFLVTAQSPDKTDTIKKIAGLTFNGPGQQSVEVGPFPVGYTVSVSEIYTGSAYAQVSADPEPVVVEAEKTNTVLIADDEENSFINQYDEHENHGHGVINKFQYDENEGWIWYKNGERQATTQ